MGKDAGVGGREEETGGGRWRVWAGTEKGLEADGGGYGRGRRKGGKIE